MKYLIDFHCHTISSDGVSTIPELAILAHKAGLGALVITDHCYSEGSFHANLKIKYTLDRMGHKFPVPIMFGAEIATPFGEFLLFGRRAVLNWVGYKEKLKKINKMFGANSYWEMFWRHVLHSGPSSIGGGTDEFGDALRDFVPTCELPYAMIMCHPNMDAETYSKSPDKLFEILHGYEIGNSGTLWRDHDSTREAVDMLKSKIKHPRELTNSDCHGIEVGSMRNEVEIPDGKPLDEGNLIHWLRNK